MAFLFSWIENTSLDNLFDDLPDMSPHDYFWSTSKLSSFAVFLIYFGALTQDADYILRLCSSSLAANHSVARLKLLSATASTARCGVHPWESKVVSSAKSSRGKFGLPPSQSQVCTKNSGGLSTDSWGSPCLTARYTLTPLHLPFIPQIRCQCLQCPTLDSTAHHHLGQ